MKQQYHISLSGVRGKNKVTLVDKDTLEKYGHQSWYLNDNGYALRSNPDGSIRIHRLIMDCPEGLVVDHLNGDRLDNRKSNLRICTQKENANNRKGDKGYSWDKRHGYYVVRYRRKWYGKYDTIDEAKKGYQLAISGVPRKEPANKKLRYLPIGITKEKGKYKVFKYGGGAKEYLGYYDNLEKAKQVLITGNRG